MQMMEHCAYQPLSGGAFFYADAPQGEYHLKCIHMSSLMPVWTYYQHTVVVRAFSFYGFSGALFVIFDDEPEVSVKRGNVINGYGKQFIVQNHTRTRINRCENTPRWQEYI